MRLHKSEGGGESGETMKCTLQGTDNLSSSKALFEDDVPFPKVGYVSFLEDKCLHCIVKCVVIFQKIHGYSMDIPKRSQAQHACKRISSRSQTMHTFRSLPSGSTCFQVGCQAELDWNLGRS